MLHLRRVKLGEFTFVWDPEKARENVRKHGVSFLEAATVFRDVEALDLQDRAHHDRHVLIGHSDRARLLFTVFAEIYETLIRIISARRATPEERRDYARQHKK